MLILLLWINGNDCVNIWGNLIEIAEKGAT
jgi:hypothetical protein